MSERRVKVPLAFGPGLDKASGPMVVQPGSMEDLRNWYLQDGRLQARKGFGEVSTLPAVTHTLGGRALRQEGVAIIVGWSSVTGDVSVLRTESDGTNPELLGTWFNTAEVPVVHLAESFGRMFLAHDEPALGKRAPTLVYDTITPDVSVLEDLELLLEGETPQPALFRGVVNHLDYLAGWGYGQPSEDRPELVRMSLPGQPRSFNRLHYFIVGDRRDPVVACVPGASDLIAFKGSEWHGIVGTNRANFGQVRRDPLYGLVSPRLAVNVSGLVFFWSGEGPRVTDGQAPSESLEIPLDLGGFEPDDLPDEGSLRDAFAVYVPNDRVVLFVFGRRAYALTIRQPGDWKWSLWTLGMPAPPLSGFTLAEVETQKGPPVGWPEWGEEEPGGSFVDIPITNRLQDGDENIEVWLRTGSDPTDPYDLVRTVAASPLEEQVIRVIGLEAATEYQGAVRYRRGTLVHPSYSNSNPDAWPAVSRGSFTTTLDPPVVGGARAWTSQRFAYPEDVATLVPGANLRTWQRLSDTEEVVRFYIRPHTLGEQINVYRRPDGGAWALLESILAADSRTSEEDGFIYEDDSADGETRYEYTARTFVGAAESPNGEIVSLWVGPRPEGHKPLPPGVVDEQIPNVQITIDATVEPAVPNGYFWSIRRDPALWPPGHEAPQRVMDTEIHDNFVGDPGGAAVPPALRDTVVGVAPITNAIASDGVGIPTIPNQILRVDVRYKLAEFGVDDFSDYKAVTIEVWDEGFAS